MAKSKATGPWKSRKRSEDGACIFGYFDHFLSHSKKKIEILI